VLLGGVEESSYRGHSKTITTSHEKAIALFTAPLPPDLLDSDI